MALNYDKNSEQVVKLMVEKLKKKFRNRFDFKAVKDSNEKWFITHIVAKTEKTERKISFFINYFYREIVGLPNFTSHFYYK